MTTTHCAPIPSSSSHTGRDGLIADCSPDGEDPASQPMPSHFENAVTPADLFRLRDVLVD